jgi:hypothetical protein
LSSSNIMHSYSSPCAVIAMKKTPILPPFALDLYAACLLVERAGCGVWQLGLGHVLTSPSSFSALSVYISSILGEFVVPDQERLHQRSAEQDDRDCNLEPMFHRRECDQCKKHLRFPPAVDPSLHQNNVFATSDDAMLHISGLRKLK